MPCQGRSSRCGTGLPARTTPDLFLFYFDALSGKVIKVCYGPGGPYHTLISFSSIAAASKRPDPFDALQYLHEVAAPTISNPTAIGVEQASIDLIMTRHPVLGWHDELLVGIPDRWAKESLDHDIGRRKA